MMVILQIPHVRMHTHLFGVQVFHLLVFDALGKKMRSIIVVVDLEYRSLI